MDLKALLQEKVEAHNELNQAIIGSGKELDRLLGEIRLLQKLVQEKEDKKKPVKTDK